MGKGYKSIFWGFIFLIFQIKLGVVYIVPSFISYALIYYGLKVAAKNYEIKALSESAKYCAFLILPRLIEEYFTLSETDIFMKNPTFHILWLTAFGVVNMIFIYKFLKGSSEILESKENILSEGYRKRANIYVILASISLVISNMNVTFMITDLWTIIAVFKFFVNIWIISTCEGLGKALAN